MKVIIIKNGNTRILLQPEDDIEKMILADMAKNPVEVHAPDRTEIIGVNYSDSIILSNQKIETAK